MIRSIALFAALAFVLAGAARAQPAPPPEFTREFQAGIDAYRLGAYADARAHLERARAIDATLPGPHRFLAAVDAAESKWDDCIADARRAIAANPASSEIAATRKLHDDCRASLGLPAFPGDYAGGGAIAVTANVAGAAVSLGGLRSGSTPLAPRPIGLGDVEVTATKAGWKATTATVTILPGVVTDVALVLVEEAAGPAIDTEHPALPDRGWLIVAAPTGAQITIDGAALTVDDRGRYALTPGDHTIDVEQTGSIAVRRSVHVSRGGEQHVEIALVSLAGVAKQRHLGRIAFGAAVGLGAVGVVTGLMSMHAYDEARDWAELERVRPTTAPIADTAAFAPIHTRADIAARGDRGHTLAIASGVSYALAAVAAGAGIYLYSRGPDEHAVELSPMLGDGWGVALRGALP